MHGAARDRRKMLWSFRALYELLDTCSFHSDVEDKKEGEKKVVNNRYLVDCHRSLKILDGCVGGGFWISCSTARQLRDTPHKILS